MSKHYRPGSFSKIANISTDDVRSYVTKLIEKELGPMIIGNDRNEKTGETIATQHKNVQARPEQWDKKEELADE